MKKTSIFLGLLLSVQICTAQNPLFQLSNGPIMNMDYAPAANQYALISPINTNPLNGWPNTNAHILLNVFDNSTNTIVLSKTYVTSDEVAGLAQCPGLGAYYRVGDVRKTSDGGYIICGSVLKDQEVAHCTFGLTYDDAFLLKTDMSGNVMWYKRYNSMTGHLENFNSVIENEMHNGYIVCGSKENNGFMMGVDAMGSVQWSHVITAYQYGRGNYQIPSWYTRICRYTDPSTQQIYYVLTGRAGQEFNVAHMLSYGGGLLTVIDANGSVFNNVQISNDANIQFMQFSGVTDAFDGDVVITGYTAASIGGGTCTIGTDYNGNTVIAPYDPYDIVSLKINPLTMSQSFLKVYETSLDNRGWGVVAHAAGGNISISANSNSGGVYLETDVNGNLVRFSGLGSSYGCNTVTYNTVNGYAAYAGGATGGGYIIKNKFGNDACATDYSPSVTLPQPLTVNNDIQDDQINEYTEPMAAYNIAHSESLICGSAKKTSPTGISKMDQTNKITVYPNPTDNFINIVLPTEMKSGNIEIFDMIGKLVYSSKFNNAEQTQKIDISGLSPSAYLVIVKNENVKYNATITKY